ncbi:MAG: glutamine amidotransferase [Gaiellaceae bacterium]|nr:glutamine amidotransferase [Gaiellaceae bacterium]
MRPAFAPARSRRSRADPARCLDVELLGERRDEHHPGVANRPLIVKQTRVPSSPTGWHPAMKAPAHGFAQGLYDRAMCRVLAYLGEPISLAQVLFETDSSLVRQSYSPRMMNTFLNLAGFGMVAWDPCSVRAGDPFTYRETTLPAFDRNLRNLATKLAPTCLIAHVRGVTYGEHEMVAQTNLHPFRFHGAGVALAHNGHLREFARMRYDLLQYIRPELAQRIEGTTDSEWIYALVVSQLEDPDGLPGTRELADAVTSTLRVIREVRTRHGIDTSSPVNLCLTTGQALVATRFSFDYGWYPDDDALLETDLPYVSLWYTLGGEYVQGDGGAAMAASDSPRSLLIASEPLTIDTSSWLEVPEYSMIIAALTPIGLDFEMHDLDV